MEVILKPFFALSVAGIVLVALSACDVNPSEFGNDEAKSAAKKLTYVQDKRTGLCFALIASRKTAHASQSGMGITHVPCGDKVMKLVVN